jgi:simple sugar transport system substrate-binding protein
MTHVLCVMQEQSNVGLEARCDGADETFSGDLTKITTSGDADPTTSQQEIKAALESDDSIDAIFATGPIGAVLAAAAAEELSRDVMIGSVDLSTDLLDAIDAGTIAFTIDQQQYLQGYLAVVFLYLNITNANTVGGGLPVYTGPGFVTKDNVAQVRDLVAAGTR